VLVLIVVGVLGSACSSSGSGGGSGVTVKMQDFKFVPLHVTVPLGRALTFVNEGSATHNFTILNGPKPFSLDVAPGVSSTTDPIGQIVLQPGDYRFECKYHKDRGMIGLLTVTGASP
jgi:plastocyanin